VRGAVALFLVALSAPALASPLFELSGDVQGDGGFGARAVESGAASTYFNPAFLPDAEPGLDLGVFLLADQIGIRLRGRPSATADVPVEAVNMERPGGGRYRRYGIPTLWLDQGKAASPPDPSLRARPRQGDGSGHNVRAYQVIGLVHKAFDGRLGVGLYALIPYGGFTGASAFYSDEREQYFSNSLHPELYADRLTATALSFGLGARLHERLSLGAAFTLSLRTVATTPTYVTDVGRFDDIMIDSDVSVVTALSPHLGLVWRPARATRLGLTLHTPQKLEIGTDFSFLLGNGLEQRARVSFTHAYLPFQAAAGVAQDIGRAADGTFTLVASALYAWWSSYIDRHSERAAAAYRWYNTLSGTLGLRYRRGGARTFFDLGYQPSPVPAQTGRTNYVDNDRAAATAGFDWRLPIGGGRVRAGLQAQVHRLLPRDTEKATPPPSPDGDAPLTGVLDEVPDNAVVGGQPLAGREGLQTNNPGWPGFSSAGWILGAAINFTVAY
jgi:hypothetical protein